jgi:hypothetical protein
MQLMFKQLEKNTSELNQWLDMVAKAAIKVFQLNKFVVHLHFFLLFFKDSAFVFNLYSCIIALQRRIEGETGIDLVGGAAHLETADRRSRTCVKGCRTSAGEYTRVERR